MHPKYPLIENAVHSVLKPLGFKKHKCHWTRVLPEVVQKITLDKSTYGPQYSIDFGITVRKLSDNQRPGLADHVRWDPTYFIKGPKQTLWIRAGDLDDKTIDDAHRSRQFVWVMRRYVLPILEEYDTYEKIRAFVSTLKPKWPTDLVTIEESMFT